jgi:hypothetical protein
MEAIKSLFDQTRDIYRTIEKVISYSASQESRLKAEISEYIVTESIEEQLEKLLMKMQLAMEMDGENEIGVWVSGFYGSGKSSLTKYLGLAMDARIQIDGVPFLRYLQDRLHKPQTKVLLAAIAGRFPAAVVFLDLASEMLAGASMEDVSTVLYYKVLQWAGYSRNLKVAALERRLQKDGRHGEFKQKIVDDLGMEWSDVQNDPLVVDSVIPEIAHQMYPQLFKTPTAFSAETSDFVRFENERVQEMIKIVRETSCKQYIIFIVDEVGQYVGSRQNLILNLDGLAKNLKDLGGGKVWIIGTAQQTLTEDDPRSALNSPELYKLKDRFPIQIDLESSDIKEICNRRLLGKSPQGEIQLGKLFDQYGQSLRHHTKLQDAKYYDSDFNKETFVNLYPFLPAHFDILLHLLGALAKSTGGIGLRSAIKVIQDILIEEADGRSPVAEHTVGWLATTVTLYDSLEKDIKRAFPSIHHAVEKTLIRFTDSTLHQEIAKTVAVLQILGNLPVNVQNVASLIYPAIDAPSCNDDIEKAVNGMINDPLVPFGQQDGNNLCFFSEKLNDIEQERAQISLKAIETRRIFNEALREAFTPPPSTHLNGALAVTTGLKSQTATITASLSGEREIIQTIIEFVESANYEAARSRIVDESRQRSSQNTVYLLGRIIPEIDEKVAEIYRCQEICRRHQNELDQEVKKYCAAQSDRASVLSSELKLTLKNCLVKGSFIFCGQTTAVESLDQDVLEAARKYLADIAVQVFNRFAEAPVRVETAVAEQFLRAGNLMAVTAKIDPLGIVKIVGGKPLIKTDHKAIVSIRDYLDRNGTVEGRRLIDYFTGAPFGWSPDTLRYLVAMLLVAGEIKLKVSGREVTVNGQQAIDALKTNNAFKNVGVALREGRPSMEVLARASERLTELVGDRVVPLEDEISKTAAKYLPQFQSRFANLEGKLSVLGLPGSERIRSLSREISDMLITDASDAPQRLGGEESSLYDSLKWAGDVDNALKQGLEETIHDLQLHKREIQLLPRTDVPGRLYEAKVEELGLVAERLDRDDFYKHTADLNTMLTDIKAQTRDAAIGMAESQKSTIRAGKEDICRLSEWGELTQEEQANVYAQLDALSIEVSADLQGLKLLISQEFVINSRLRDLKELIVRQGKQRQLERIEEEKERAKQDGKTKVERSIRLPSTVISADQLDELIRLFQELKKELAFFKEIEVTIKIEG